MKKALILIMALMMAFGAEAKKDHKTQVRWGTFNIRIAAQKDIELGCGWDKRKNPICQWVKDQNLDIIGYQEVTEKQYADLIERLPEYDNVMTGREKGEKGEATPIFYKRDKYKLLENGHFSLSETPEVVGVKGWDAQCCRIVSWAKLQDRKTKRIFMAVNTHVDHMGAVAKVESCKLIKERVQAMCGDDIPAVVTADYNFGDTADAYKVMTTGDFYFRDAYIESPMHQGVRYTYTGFKEVNPDKAPRVDILFITHQIEVVQTGTEPHSMQAVLSDHNPHWGVLKF